MVASASSWKNNLRTSFGQAKTLKKSILQVYDTATPTLEFCNKYLLLVLILRDYHIMYKIEWNDSDRVVVKKSDMESKEIYHQILFIFPD